MKKTATLILLLLLAPGAAHAADAEFFRDARFYCNCIVTKPDDIHYRLQDYFFITFEKETGQAVLEAEHYDNQTTVDFSAFGPLIKFSGDCGTRGRGMTVLRLLISFSFADECSKFAYRCWGFRRRLAPKE